MTPQAESSRSHLSSLLNKFGDQLLRLFDAHLALFKAELKGAARIYSQHLILTISSALVALVGFSFLSIGLVFWANEHINNVAISFGCVAGVYLTIGVLSALAAVKRMTHQSPVFNRTLEELESDQQWIKTETQPAR
jgi:uncharacterized membrane protein YqjE